MLYYPMSCHGVTFPGRYLEPNGTFWLQGGKFLKTTIVWESCRGVYCRRGHVIWLLWSQQVQSCTWQLASLHQYRFNAFVSPTVIYPEAMFRPWTSINNYDISSRSISPKQYDLIGVNGEVFVMNCLKIAKTTINRKWYQFMDYDHSLQMTALRYKGAEYDRYMIGDDGFIYDTQPAGEYSPPYYRMAKTNQW